jgi:hypothetical protein
MKYLKKYTGFNANKAVDEYFTELDKAVKEGRIKNKKEAKAEFKRINLKALDMQNQWGKFRVEIYEIINKTKEQK